MAITSIASIQSVLDTTPQGRGTRIVRSVRVSSIKESRYVVPGITTPGRSRWVDTSTTSSASTIAATITTAIGV